VSQPPTTRVTTGADDHGRHRIRHLLVGLLGWLLWAGLIVSLASQASNDALNAVVFLVTVIVTVALLVVLTGAGLLRPALMRERARTPVPVKRQLERPLPESDSPTQLTGEIGLRELDGARRYVPLTRTSP
jgi:hypothetical protein